MRRRSVRPRAIDDWPTLRHGEPFHERRDLAHRHAAAPHAHDGTLEVGGHAGRYDVDLTFTIYSGLTVDNSTLKEPLLKEAMEDYLGLRLESRQETRQALVIDRVTLPAPD